MAVEGKHKNLLKGKRLPADLSVLRRRRDGTTATMETSSAANNFTLQWTAQCSTARPLGTRPMIFCMMARELPATPKPAAPSHGKLKTERKRNTLGERSESSPKRAPYQRRRGTTVTAEEQTRRCFSPGELFIDTSATSSAELTPDTDCKDGTSGTHADALHTVY